MKYLILALPVVFSLTALSATRLQFFPGDRNAMALLTPTDPFGNSDSDSTDLYMIMSVPEQDTMLGKGKSIVSPQRDFNLVCGEYKNQCQIILNKSKNVIFSAKKSMRFEATGEDAAILTSQFKLNDKGEAFFQTSDKMLIIKGNSNDFVFEAGF